MNNDTYISYVTMSGKFMVHKEGCKSLDRITFTTKKLSPEEANSDRRSKFCKKCFPIK